jgi:hypothetical protein
MFWFYFELFIMFLWQLPQNIVALLMMPFMCKMKLVRYDLYAFAFEYSKMSGAISLGNFIFLSPMSAQNEETILHEYGHVIDSQRFGWLYLFIIGIPSILWAGFFSEGKCYYDFFTEKRANQNAGLKVAKNQYGCYTYIPKEKNTEQK